MKKLSKLIITAVLCTILTGNLIPLPCVNNSIATKTAFAQTDNSLPLITDPSSTNYMSYSPRIVCSDTVKKALDVKNPTISIDASSAILLKSDGGVLYYENRNDHHGGEMPYISCKK